ncbi:MAG: hypothetical protein ABUL67_03080, partial [Haliangium ochraceum]
MAAQGAGRVVCLDTDATAVDAARARFQRANLEYRAVSDLRQAALLSERFDVLFVPDGRGLVADPDLIPGLRRLLTESGNLVIAVPSADRKPTAASGGVGYYQLSDVLARHFPSVRMFGQTPFMGFGLVEFDGGAEAMRIDATLVEGGAEPPSHYIAAAGNVAPAALGYALVQVPFAPVESAVRTAEGRQVGAVDRPAREPASPAERDDAAAVKALQESQSAQAAQAARIRELNGDVGRLSAELERLRQSERTRGADTTASQTRLDEAERRVEEAERRVEEAERRTRARLDEAELRATEFRRKLDDAVVQGESSMRIARAQGEEMEELRGRLRRAVEDRSAADTELGKLRRALTEADESVLTLTRRTAEEMAAVAQRIAIGLRAPIESEDSRERLAELQGLREEAERLRGRVTEAETRAVAAERRLEDSARAPRRDPSDEAKLKAAREEVAGRDERIARLEGERQDLIWRIAEQEEKLRHAESDLANRKSGSNEVSSAIASRDRAIEEFHRASAAHVNEVNRLQATVGEQAALVTELEDALAVVEERAAVAEKDAAGLRRNAKELEEADRARRGRLAELEGKLLRLEREKAIARESAPVGDGVGPGPNNAAVFELTQRLQS